jgi:hypothetical protein
MSDDDTPSAFEDPVVLKQAARIFRAARARPRAEGDAPDSVILSVNPPDRMDGVGVSDG